MLRVIPPCWTTSGQSAHADAHHGTRCCVQPAAACNRPRRCTQQQLDADPDLGRADRSKVDFATDIRDGFPGFQADTATGEPKVADGSEAWFMLFDTETTGFSRINGHIINFCCIVFQAKDAVFIRELLVKGHRITSKEVKDAGGHAFNEDICPCPNFNPENGRAFAIHRMTKVRLSKAHGATRSLLPAGSCARVCGALVARVHAFCVAREPSRRPVACGGGGGGVRECGTDPDPLCTPHNVAGPLWVWRGFLDWLENITKGLPTTAVAHNGHSFDLPFLAAALKKARLRWPPCVRRQVDTLHILNCAGLGEDPAPTDLSRGNKLDGTPVARVGEHKHRSLAKVFRQLVHGEGFKGLKLTAHEADSDVAATFLMFTHRLIYGKAHKFSTAIMAAKRTATAHVEADNAAGSGMEDEDDVGDPSGAADGTLPQAGSDMQADATEDAEASMTVDENADCLLNFKWERGEDASADAEKLSRPRHKGKPAPPVDAEPGSDDRPGGRSRLEGKRRGGKGNKSVLSPLEELLTRQDENGKSPMNLLVSESNTCIRQRWAARVVKRAAVHVLCNKLCAKLRGDPGECKDKVEACQDIADMRAKTPAKLDGSWISHATHRWTRAPPAPSSSQSPHSSTAPASDATPPKGTLVYAWKPEHRPDTVHRYVSSKISPAPVNTTCTEVACPVTLILPPRPWHQAPPCIETVVAARAKDVAEPKGQHTSRQCTELDEGHVCRFIAVLILAGVHGKHGDFDSWWSEDELLAFPIVRSVCSKAEFLFTLRHVHTSDNAFDHGVGGERTWAPRRGDAAFNDANSAPHDKGRKMRLWLDLLNDDCQSTHDVGRDLSFDEAMMASVARCVFRVFMRDKPIKRGFKLWCVCDAVTRHCYQAEPCTGEPDLSGDGDATLHKTLGALGCTVHAALRSAELLDTGRHVVFDRAFSCIPLFHKLRVANTTATGTVNANRKGVDVDDFEFDGSCERGSVSFGHARIEGDTTRKDRVDNFVLTFMRWMDSKDVLFLSTEAGVGHAVGEDVTKRNKKSAKAPTLYMDHFHEPFVRKLHNWLMGGVDQFDQLRAFGNIRLKRTKRWWVPIFIASVDMCIVNSFLHWQDFEQHQFGTPTNRRLTQKEFRLAIVREIRLKHCTGAPAPGQFPLGDVLRHCDDARRGSKLSLWEKLHRAGAAGFKLVAGAFGAARSDDTRHWVDVTTEKERNGTRKDKFGNLVARFATVSRECQVCKAERRLSGEAVPAVKPTNTTPNKRNPAYTRAAGTIKTPYVCQNPVCAGNSGPTHIHPRCVLRHEDALHAC